MIRPGTNHGTNMKLDQLMKNVGAVVTGYEAAESKVKIRLRVDLSPGPAARWREFVNSLLRIQKIDTSWTGDVSQHMYLDRVDNTVYAWRIILEGDTDRGLSALAQCVKDAVSASRPKVQTDDMGNPVNVPSIESFPLVGRKESYSGLQGAHSATEAAKLRRERMFSKGGPS